MKLLLLAPPIFDFYFTPARAEPLGLLYLKAAVHHYCPDIMVDLYNARTSGKKKPMQRPACFNHLSEIYVPDRSVFSLMSKYQRFGDSFQKIVSKVVQGGYDVVAISSLFSGYHPDVEDLIHAIKNESQAIVIVGGWAIKADSVSLEQKSAADFLVTGGEESFCWLLTKLACGNTRNQLPRLISDELGEELAPKGSFFLSEKPVRDEPHQRFGKKVASVTLSRGCVMRCGFCSIHRYQSYACRSLESVEKELAELADRGIDVIDFEDDHLFDQRLRPAELLEVLGALHQKGVSFMAMNGITAPHLKPFAARALDAGFMEFNLSLVTAQSNVAKKLDRPLFSSAIEEIARVSVNRASVVVYMILGLSGQTVASALKDILYLASLPVVVGVSPLYLLPGIPMFDAMGVPDERRLCRGSALYKFEGNQSRFEVAALWKLVRFINAIKAGEVDEENQYYFRRSLVEKTWYHLTFEGWQKGVMGLPDFGLPSFIRIVRLDGSVKTIDL